MTIRKKSTILIDVVALLLILAVFVSPSPAASCIDVQKTVYPEVSIVGDKVTYEICVTNCGDTDLVLIVVEDTHLGGVLPGFPTELPPGGMWCEAFVYEIQPGDPDPLVNEVMASGIEDVTGSRVEDYDDAVVDLVEVGIDITKTVDNPNPCFGDIVTYNICIENTGDWPLENVVVTDPHLGGVLPGFPIELLPGGTWCEDFPYEVQEDDPCPLVNCAMVTANPLYFPDELGDEDCAEICPEPCGGDEGCTPGFWKNNADKHGASAWCDLFSPDMPFSAVFQLNELLTISGNGKSTITDPTLLQALGANGGGVNAMVRHGVAALLNACSDCVNYAIGDPLQVIFMIEDTLNGVPGAYTVDELHSMFAENNEAGCPVNQHGDCVGVEEEIEIDE